MKTYSPLTIIKIAAVLTALAAYVFNVFTTEPIDESLLNTYEDFSSYTLINKKPIVYQVDLKSGEPGYLVFNSERGYQSDIVMATLIDKSANIINVKVYSENETKVFFKRLYDWNFFRKNFTAKNIKNGFSVNTNVDAVTGATISSAAVSKAIHDGSTYIGGNYLDMDIPNPYEKIKVGKVDVAIIIMFALVLTAFVTKNKHLKTLTLVYSFLIMGFEFMQFISFSTFISFFTFSFPSVYENLRWYLLFLGSLALVMFTGKNLYCSYICPFGAMQLMEYKFAKLHFYKVSGKIIKIFRLLPGFIAWIAFVTAMFAKDISAVNYEPFTLVFGRVGLEIQWILLPIIVFMSLVLARYYCSYGCPVGYIWNLLIRIRKNIVKWEWKK